MARRPNQVCNWDSMKLHGCERSVCYERWTAVVASRSTTASSPPPGQRLRVQVLFLRRGGTVVDSGVVVGDEGEAALGVALSGGGHRASLWAAGALFGLADADAQGDVVSISSVSGGSIANGVLAAHLDYTTTTCHELEVAMQPAIWQWTHDGLFFPGSLTDGYVARVLFLATLLSGLLVGAVATLVALGRDWSMAAVGFAAGAALVASLVGGLVVAGKVPSPYRPAIVAGLSTTGLSVAAGVAAGRAAHGGPALVVVLFVAGVITIAWTVTSRAFGRRSEMVDGALAASVLSRGGHRVDLGAADRKVHHVFCATNLASADHVYLTPRLVYGNRLGCGAPAPGFALSTAVQASACLPGAFAPRSLTSATVAAGLVDATLVVTDGGVYDNLADQWELGYRNRARRFADAGRDLGTYQARPCDELVVVSAGQAFTHRPVAASGLRGELTALLRCKDVLYDVSTSLRRRYLVEVFSGTKNQSEPGEEADLRTTKLNGVLVHIAQTPHTVPRAMADSDPGTSERARRAGEFLGRLQQLEPVDWRVRSKTNAGVKTTLAPIGPAVAADLMHHAYVLTRINAFVVLNRGILPGPDALDPKILGTWGRQRFLRLCQAASAAGDL